ncbi:glycerol-3-phosphate dehydrogenase/oxidase [Alkalibacillus salilacus]|uniref:Glycerol-3-phosphate dehydrogenase n=1 Tax=Alkalibacillus salilacus TaxID=284582 RepID=A0ABT9VFH4_9BACI|nr:glycerol-3-phosphate dehydrogenase/oxidase [Alkalibacillus salilacus]MDQ0159620.1 glycerol-3-phosphate dehydrogenase [Alkalibacillus salilacus]
MTTFTNQNRSYNKQSLNHSFDLIVIGGGITGAGIALDAVTRGMDVAVLEMQDFAAGTSSRSTKLVHGGLRYLKNFEIKLVAEVGREREIVYENGPHITTPEWMMLPFYKGGNFGPFSSNIGLRVYDFLAGVKRSERRKMLSVDETLKREPLLKHDGLKGSGYYVEYKTDDARLTVEVMKKAVEFGAQSFNYMQVEQLLYNDGKVIGVQVRDRTDDSIHDVYSHYVVNATGPWVDEIRKMDQSNKGKHLYHTKGVHLVFDQDNFPLQQAIYFDAPDGRMIFAIPREGKTYVGTTDTHYESDLTHPDVKESDQNYILDAIHQMFPDVHLIENDIESTWAGIRPLIHEEGKDPSEISRKDEVLESDSGLLSIAGGKLTGYRKMAEEIVDQVSSKLKKIDGRPYVTSKTKHQPIAGGDIGGSKGFAEWTQQMIHTADQQNIDKKTMLTWLNRYGSNAGEVLNHYLELEEDDELLHALLAELHYTIENEAIYKPEDFFIRRTGDLFFNIDTVKAYKQAVIDEMNALLDWTEKEYQTYIESLDQMIAEAELNR